MFGTPLYLNEKCIAFSIFVIAVYFLPHQKYWQHEVVFVFVLATFAYVLMAWYDYTYDCNDRLGPTLLGWMSMWFKPQEYRDKYEELPVKYKKLVQTFDIVILIILSLLVFAPYPRIPLSR